MYLIPDSQVQYLMICWTLDKPRMAYTYSRDAFTRDYWETQERDWRKTRERLQRDWRGAYHRLTRDSLERAWGS